MTSATELAGLNFPDYSRAWRIEQYRSQHTPRPDRLAMCVQVELPQPRYAERVEVVARERLGVKYVGEGDPDEGAFDPADYTFELGEPFHFTLMVPIEASTQMAETARYFRERGLSAHAFADWPTCNLP